MELRLDMPTDGMPVIRDWVVCLESMLMGGIELSREPLSVNAACFDLFARTHDRIAFDQFTFELTSWFPSMPY